MRNTGLKMQLSKSKEYLSAKSRILDQYKEQALNGTKVRNIGKQDWKRGKNLSCESYK